VKEAAAAIFVITRDAIRRSGAMSIAEILRLAPNLHVARLDANNYAITARGFNQPGGTANKLLVLIDGRPIYSPLFSGTFWDAQKTFIDDIDRIEVISGPGGTLWGANAVNGVINIITRDAIETRGWNVDARAGTLDQRLGVRGGSSIGANGSIRGYGLGVALGSMIRADGEETGDDWNHMQGGFRGDWRRNGDRLTLQGDIYRGTGIGNPGTLLSGEISGGNLSSTWLREFRNGSSLSIQAYADRARRILVSGIDARVDQYAVEGQYDLAIRGGHSVVAGAGLRFTEDEFRPGPGTTFLDPSSRTLHFANVFIHDTLTLGERWKLAGGIKLEDNSYTGLEFMPDVRLTWTPSQRTALWTALSRAVRTPSRFDTDVVNRNVLNGNPDFESEVVVAWEAGYRGLIGPSLSVSISTFYNWYDALRSIEPSGPAVFPLVIGNAMEGETWGVEAWAEWSIRDSWRLSAGVATLEKDLRIEEGRRDVFGVAFAGNDPQYHWRIRASIDLPRDFDLDLTLRQVGALESPAVDAYLEADAHIGWRVAEAWSLALEGQNLLHESHLEFVNPSLPPSEVPRSLTLVARWTP
jgi:iron complex outermembrane receptor protein